MKKWIVASVFVLAVGLVAQASWAHGRHSQKVLAFQTMTPVVAPYTLAASAPLTRGVQGGGVPWQIDQAKGKLKSNGDLELEVEGLVIASTGMNPVNPFSAIVSCLSVDSGGAAVIVNRTTDTFPATTTGDAEFDGHVSLPSPCIAPIIFVTNGAGTRWFAATGA